MKKRDLAFEICKVLVLAVLILSGCADPNSLSICREYGKIRPCSAKEQSVIQKMQAIIEAVRAYRSNSIETNSLAKVKFYGEIHTDTMGKIANLGRINHDFQEGDILLLEGGDRKYAYPNCALNLIKNIFYAHEFSKLNIDYFPDFMDYLNNKYDYETIFEITRESFQLSDLNISRLQCGYWDIDHGIIRSMSEYKRDKLRNQSMVNCIDKLQGQNNRVLIMAGLAHLPSGELMFTRALNQSTVNRIPTNMYSYYNLVKIQRKLPPKQRSLYLDSSAASTKPIYDYLVKKNISYKEYFHGQPIP